ncbi:MAG: phosphatase [Actinomycetota bacterium]|nr:phosphatase [Actinomycetota bacterium]
MTTALDAAPTREALLDQLVASRIAGRVATPRDNNLRNFGKMSRREPGYTFGLRPTGTWTPGDVLALMAEKVGVSPDPAFTEGVDTIDPARTVAALEAMSARLALAAGRRERVLVATGHPAGILAIHLDVVAALRARGCPVLTPAAGAGYTSERGQFREIRHLGGVAMISGGGGLEHTHSPLPMERMLAALSAAGQPPPDLVVADHGWAGAAGQAGVDTVGFADCNDPALFVSEAEGLVRIVVPLDDNVEPMLYAPLTAYLLQGVAAV